MLCDNRDRREEMSTNKTVWGIHEVERETDLMYLLRLQGQLYIIIIYNENLSYSVTIQPKNQNTFYLTEILNLGGGEKYLRNFLRKVRDFYVHIN